MATQHSVKFGDPKAIKWEINRDFADITAVRIVVAEHAGDAPVIDVDSTTAFASFADAGAGKTLVTLKLQVSDFGTNATTLQAGHTYLAEAKTSPGPLTHPDDIAAPYAKIAVLASLG